VVTHHRATARHLLCGITECYVPATRHRRTRPALSPTRLAGTWFTYPRGMEGWVDLVSACLPRIFPVTRQWGNTRNFATSSFFFSWQQKFVCRVVLVT